MNVDREPPEKNGNTAMMIAPITLMRGNKVTMYSMTMNRYP
jgi:hypothetical protein